MGYSGDPRIVVLYKMPGFHHYGDPRYTPYRQISGLAHEGSVSQPRAPPRKQPARPPLT